MSVVDQIYIKHQFDFLDPSERVLHPHNEVSIDANASLVHPLSNVVELRVHVSVWVTIFAFNHRTRALLVNPLYAHFNHLCPSNTGLIGIWSPRGR